MKVEIAKRLMQWMPNTPSYALAHFQQEYFRHPDFLSLNGPGKKKQIIQFVENDFREGQYKPFDNYYPGYDFRQLFKDKTILDLGCSIGGKSIAWAERWKVRQLVGIDINKQSVEAAKLFIAQRGGSSGVRFDFRTCASEHLPFHDGRFDAIITEDTIEHLQDIRATLLECHRVLRKGGRMFCVFPSYRFPFGGAHLGSAARTPFLEWLFAPTVLNEAYRQITSGWEDAFSWFKPEHEGKMNPSKKIRGGIGTNCILRKEFERIVNGIGFSSIEFLSTPLLSVGNTSVRHPVVKRFSRLLKPLLKIPALADYLSHRLVYIFKA